MLSYARRLLTLAEEARDVLREPDSEGAIRLGIPEDFAAYRLAKLLAPFSRSHPGLRMDVRADQSKNLSRDLERGELDLALFKREAGAKGAIAVWPERGHWVTSKSHPVDVNASSVPLIGFPLGCLFAPAPSTHWKARAAPGTCLTVIESAASRLRSPRAWLSILSEMSIQSDHRVLTAEGRIEPINRTEVALMASPGASPATLRLADRLAEFCDNVQAKAGVITPRQSL